MAIPNNFLIKHVKGLNKEISKVEEKLGADRAPLRHAKADWNFPLCND